MSVGQPTEQRILVVDDERQIRRLLTVSLGSGGYTVESVGTGTAALDRLLTERFDAVLLDLGLPDIEGVEVCRRLREWSAIPVIVISVRDDERDKVAALDAGADDYVSKPFGVGELLARIRANLRRVPGALEEPVIDVGPLTIDRARRVVTLRGADVRLTPTEYDLLRILAGYAGRVVTHRQLLREARGPAYEEDTPLLRVHMVGLRQKLGLAPHTPGYIATEPGIGYRMLT